MEYLKRMILLFLIAGFASLAITQPTPPETDDVDDEYAADDDYTYDDDAAEPNPPTHIENNETTGDPPYFDKLEDEQLATVGESIILPCNAKNLKGSNIIFWYNKTTHVSQLRSVLTDRAKISLDNDFGLRIKNVQLSDSSDYFCEVLPQKIRKHIRLVVSNTVPQVAIYSGGRNVSDRAITFNEGDRVEFECRSFNIDNPEFKWSLKGTRINANNNVTSLENGKIIIENVDHHHHGLYQCIGDSGEKYPPHSSVQLNIFYKPKITITRHYCNTAIGDTAELYCSYHALPSPTDMGWHKGGMSLKLTREKYETKADGYDELYQKNRSILFVKNVEPADLGEYQCTVRNNLGEGSGKIHLILEPEPAHYESMNVSGKRVSLHWLVRSKQPLSDAILDYQINGSQTWMSESPISPKQHEHTGTWRIRHELELTPGTWHVRVKTKNTAGWSKFSKDHSFVIENSPESNIIPKDDVLAAGIGGTNENNSASRHNIILSSTFVCSLLLVTLSIVPSLFRL